MARGAVGGKEPGSACLGRREAEAVAPAARREIAESAFLSQVKQNIRVRFSKRGDIRFISHHDLMRLFERSLRRADLPVAMSEGHNPRPRVSFPMALSVGLTGLSEVADVGLSEWVRPAQFQARLTAELPEGIGVVSVEITQPHPSHQPTELAYRVPLLPGHSLTDRSVQEFLARLSVIVRRSREDEVKEVEIRQFVKALRCDGSSVQMLLRCTESGTARPEEVMEALGCRDGTDYVKSRIERTHVDLSSRAG
jgi:radical SAM-linked protein